MKTAKALGIVKGDFIVTPSGFPGIIVADAHTSMPMVEVWGLAHEVGSIYAEQLKKITRKDFLRRVENWVCCYTGCEELRPFSPLAKKLLKGIER